MSFKKFATSAAVITGVFAASLTPLATAANAHDPRRGGYDRGYNSQYYGDYHGPRHYNGRGYGANDYYYHKKRKNRGKDLAKGLAIGLGVLAVGSIIANSR